MNFGRQIFSSPSIFFIPNQNFAWQIHQLLQLQRVISINEDVAWFSTVIKGNKWSIKLQFFVCLIQNSSLFKYHQPSVCHCYSSSCYLLKSFCLKCKFVSVYFFIWIIIEVTPHPTWQMYVAGCTKSSKNKIVQSQCALKVLWTKRFETLSFVIDSVELTDESQTITNQGRIVVFDKLFNSVF